MATAELTNEAILTAVEKMPVLQLSELIKMVEERFGVSAAAPVAVAAAPAGGGTVEAVAEKTEFDVILASIGDKKIQVIKAVREVTSLGLKEAKALVDGAPTPIKTGLSKDDAEEMKKSLEASGATIEVK